MYLVPLIELTEQFISQWPSLDESGRRPFIEQHYYLFEHLGLVDTSMQGIYESMKLDPGLQDVKVSGSGLGDCFIGWGQATDDHCLKTNPKSQMFKLQIAPQRAFESRTLEKLPSEKSDPLEVGSSPKYY